MKSYHQNSVECPLGDETISAMTHSGCGAMVVGLVALFENGFVESDIVSTKELKACGIGVDLAKTIVNQCEGREWNKTKTKKVKKEPKRKKLSKEKHMYFIYLIRELYDEDPMNFKLSLMVQGRSTDELPEDLRHLKYDNSPRTFTPPEPFAIKELFFKFTYENGAEPLDLRDRGRPARLFKIPSKDSLAKLFGVMKSSDQQIHYEIYGKKTVKSFGDAFHVEWLKRKKPAVGKNQHSMKELCNIQGDSHTTVRARHKRNGIKFEHNYFSYSVNSLEVDGLLLSSRKGCKWELVLPPKELPGVSFGEVIQETRLHELSEKGFACARKEWENEGSPGNFMDCLRVYGWAANSYDLSDVR